MVVPAGTRVKTRRGTVIFPGHFNGYAGPEKERRAASGATMPVVTGSRP